MTKLFRIKSRLLFLFQAKSQYGTHSPFVYTFITKCLYKRSKDYPGYPSIKLLYRKKKGKLNYKRAKLLNRIVHYFSPENVYLLKDHKNLYEQIISAGNLVKIKPISSIWEDKKLNDKKSNLIFITKEQLKEQKIKSLQKILEYSNPHHFFIFEAIHQSEKAEGLWDIVKRKEEITVTIDIFYFGLAFCRPKQARQHFKIYV